MRQRQAQTEKEPVVQTEKAQPQTIVGTGAGGTHLPHHQMPVRLPQDPLPRLGEERLAGQPAGRFSQPVPAQEAIGRRLRGNPPKMGWKLRKRLKRHVKWRTKFKKAENHRPIWESTICSAIP